MFKDKKILKFVSYSLFLIGLLSFVLFYFSDMQYKDIVIDSKEQVQQLSEITIESETNDFMHFAAKDSNGDNVKFVIQKDSPIYKEIYLKSSMNQEALSMENLLIIGILALLFIVFTFMTMRNSSKKKSDTSKDSKSKSLSGNSEKKGNFEITKSKVKFKDVAGYEYAKEELQEIVDQLKNPDKYKHLGAKMIKGAVLTGPPGTGKTFFARAVAGEVNVPFISTTGSDFVGEYVGTGANRVKELFDLARKNAPCIIFIDEIDALATKRTGQANTKEYDNAVNALLTEIQGFNSEEHIVVLAATNIPDQVDPAVMRSGRLDRKIEIGLPDLETRLHLLNHFTKLENRKFNKDCNIKNIASMTFNFSGADLENLINEAILLSARKGLSEVTDTELLAAFEKVSMGIKVRRNLSDDVKVTVAYHEAGHAVLAKFLKPTDVIQKVTILPYGNSLGLVQKTPATDEVLQPKESLIKEIQILLAGRVSEEVFRNEITSGAESDLKHATNILVNMNTRLGMFDSLSYREDGVDYSVIDKQLQQYYDEAKKLVSGQLRTKIDYVAKVLLKKEMLTGKELDTVMLEVDKIEQRKKEKAS